MSKLYPPALPVKVMSLTPLTPKNMNNFLLERLYYKPTYTIGRLSFKGQYLCDTLEPASAHLTQNDDLQKILAEKSHGYRAIPSGMYKMAITYSPRFKKRLPLLLNVPCYEGIRIHAGNYPRDTQGCILPGWNWQKGMVCSSKAALDIILKSMQGMDDACIDIAERNV